MRRLKMLSTVKKALGAAASRSSRNPIEMIVFFLIIASFAYSSLFRSLTESEYFNEIPPFNDKIDSTKVIVHPGSNFFVPLAENELFTQAYRIQLKQITIQLKDLVGHKSQFFDKLQEFKEVIESTLEGNNKLYYNDILCLKSTKCFEINPSLLETLSHELNSSSSSHITLTYALEVNDPYLVNTWEDKISGLHFDQFVSTGNKQPVLAEKGSFAWLAFAAGSLVFKIQELIQVC